jgi:hypothetical protein
MNTFWYWLTFPMPIVPELKGLPREDQYRLWQRANRKALPHWQVWLSGLLWIVLALGPILLFGLFVPELSDPDPPAWCIINYMFVPGLVGTAIGITVCLIVTSRFQRFHAKQLRELEAREGVKPEPLTRLQAFLRPRIQAIVLPRLVRSIPELARLPLDEQIRLWRLHARKGLHHWQMMIVHVVGFVFGVSACFVGLFSGPAIAGRDSGLFGVVLSLGLFACGAFGSIVPWYLLFIVVLVNLARPYLREARPDVTFPKTETLWIFGAIHERD